MAARLTVDLGALKRNWQALDKVSRGALTGAVVKADAYGTGIAQSAQALYEAGARFFFVATPDEGIAVRAALPEDTPYLHSQRPVSRRGAALCRRAADAVPLLRSRCWRSGCRRASRRNQALPAALHFDTGINRLGFRLNEADDRQADDRGSRLCAADDHEPPRLRRYSGAREEPHAAGAVHLGHGAVPRRAGLARQFGGADDRPRQPLPDGAAGHRALWRPRRRRAAQPDGAGGDARGADPAGQGSEDRRDRGLWRAADDAARQPHRGRRHRLCRRLLPLAVVGQQPPRHACVDPRPALRR